MPSSLEGTPAVQFQRHLDRLRQVRSKDYKPTQEEWRTLARQAVKEQDPEKMVALAQEIVEAYQRLP